MGVGDAFKSIGKHIAKDEKNKLYTDETLKPLVWAPFPSWNNPNGDQTTSCRLRQQGRGTCLQREGDTYLSLEMAGARSLSQSGH